jgi:hypothetical protein
MSLLLRCGFHGTVAVVAIALTFTQARAQV